MKPGHFFNRVRKRLKPFGIFGVVVILSAIQAYTAKNYPDPDTPFYAGNYAPVHQKAAEVLTVVSYNIWFAEEIDLAVADLRQIQSQKGIDILLLQEMDEAGSEQIARQLELNYVYYPAAVEPTYSKNFGNAILSRWPIVGSEKLILPHKSLSNRMNRIATQATVHVQGKDIRAYSLHTESVFTLPRFRQDQYTTILENIEPEAQYVIVGGDFNTFIAADANKVEKNFRQSGFRRASAGSGFTIAKHAIQGTTDHIFTKGFLVEGTGTLTGATASDHLPVWVTLMLK